MRKCIKCDVDKPLSQFRKDSNGKTGRSSVCNSCRIYRRIENGEYLRERLRKHVNRAQSDSLHMTLAELKDLLAIDSCAYCGAEIDGGTKTIDHIYPLSDSYGGVLSLSNIAIACRSCNGRKGALHVYDFYRRSAAFNDELWTQFVKTFYERLVGRRLTAAEVEQAKKNLADEAEDLRTVRERQAAQYA